jgi:predicted dehydrogenase
MRTIGVGLIGTGYMGKCHALAWTGVHAVFDDVPIVRRVMLCEVEEGLARRRADEFGFESSTDDWRALIADPGVEVVSITTPNALHAQMAIAALEAGKHVWCEKPMAPSLEDSERMTAAARASGRVAILGYNYIQSPAVRYIGKLIKSGAIGRLTHFRLEMDEDYMADAEAPFSWRSQATSGYGALDDFAVHPLSLITTLIGAPNEVFGEMSKPYPDRPDGGGRREVETFDVATALLRMADGASGAIQVSRAAWGRKGRLQLQAFGARGAIVFDQERFNEVGDLHRGRAAGGAGVQAGVDGPGASALRALRRRARPSDGLQRPQGHRSPRVPELHPGTTSADHRFRRRPRDRANHPRDRALEQRGAVGGDGRALVGPVR